MKIFFIIFVLLLTPPLLASPLPTELKKIEGETFLIHLRYDSKDNFLKKNLYAPFDLHACYVHPKVWEALQKLKPQLIERKLKLAFWDCYRPPEVQKEMWKIVPDPRYVADPKNGSNHNRGVAIDVTLADEKGNYLPMPTGFDDFTPRAFPQYICKSQEVKKCQNRDLLIQLMKGVGLQVFPTEWWHYQLPNSQGFPILYLKDPVGKNE